MLRVLLALLLAAACGGPAPEVSDRTPPASTRRTPTTPPSPSPGPCRYVFPVRPAARTSYVGSHHDYDATDINAPEGSEVVAPTDGVVDFVSRTDLWRPGRDDPATRGGLAVAIVGDDGIRYYGSHLRDVAEGIEPGVRVEAGHLLGHVGTSGNARGTPPHLHFGISRPTTPEDWQVRRGQVLPFRYLNAWKQGRSVTPDMPGAAPPRCTRVS